MTVILSPTYWAVTVECWTLFFWHIITTIWSQHNDGNKHVHSGSLACNVPKRGSSRVMPDRISCFRLWSRLMRRTAKASSRDSMGTWTLSSAVSASRIACCSLPACIAGVSTSSCINCMSLWRNAHLLTLARCVSWKDIITIIMTGWENWKNGHSSCDFLGKLWAMTPVPGVRIRQVECTALKYNTQHSCKNVYNRANASAYVVKLDLSEESYIAEEAVPWAERH